MFDIFGHFQHEDDITYQPKEKVIIGAMGPWSGKVGYVVGYEGKDFYRVSVNEQSFSFHRNELRKTS